MKKTITLIQTVALLLSVGLTTSNAQETEQNENLIFDKQIRFSLSPVVYDNLKIKNQGKRHFKSYPTISGEALISYYNHIYKGYGVNVGIGLNIAPYNLNYKFKAPENSIFLTGGNEEYYEYIDLWDYEYSSAMCVFPISFNNVLPIKTSIFSIDIGAKYQILINDSFVNLVDHFFFIEEGNAIVELFSFHLEDTRKRHLVSYFLKLGIIKSTKKHNSFHFNIVANYSPTKIAKGWYMFYNLGYDSYGTVEQNINYIGFEFVYGLSLSKKGFDKN